MYGRPKQCESWGLALLSALEALLAGTSEPEPRHWFDLWTKECAARGLNNAQTLADAPFQEDEYQSITRGIMALLDGIEKHYASPP